jgi:hypothetical protein
MSGRAKAYIAAVIAAGCAVLAVGIGFWTRPDPVRLGALLALAIIASTLKIRMPGVTGTFSLNPVFIILAAAQAGLGGALLVGCAGVLAQSFWWPKRRPAPVQVVFNISNVSISTGVAWLTYGGVQAHFGPTEPYAPLAMAAASYFIVNTVLVSIVLAVVESKPLTSVLGTWLSWALPYYAIGTILASQSAPPLSQPWWGALLSLSGMLLLYLWYRWQMERLFDSAGPPQQG